MKVTKVDCTIAKGQTVSDVVDISAGELVGLYVPALDNAALTFKVGPDANTLAPLEDKDGNPVTVAASTGLISLESDFMAKLAAYPFVEITAGAAQATAIRVLQFVLKRGR